MIFYYLLILVPVLRFVYVSQVLLITPNVKNSVITTSWSKLYTLFPVFSILFSVFPYWSMYSFNCSFKITCELLLLILKFPECSNFLEFTGFKFKCLKKRLENVNSIKMFLCCFIFNI